MAARAIVLPGPQETMATKEFGQILEAINESRRENRDGLGEVAKTVAGLVSDVKHLTAGVATLETKVDRMDGQKASREDLKDAISKMDRDKIGHDQLSIKSVQDIIDRLDDVDDRTRPITQLAELIESSKDLKLIKSQVEGIHDDLEGVKADVKDLNKFKWKTGGGLAVLAVLVAEIIRMFGSWMVGHVAH